MKIKTKPKKPKIIAMPTGTPVAEVKKVAKLEFDFGRVDLNLMRDKINEIIDGN